MDDQFLRDAIKKFETYAELTQILTGWNTMNQKTKNQGFILWQEAAKPLMQHRFL